jgi:hypothetical protein
MPYEVVSRLDKHALKHELAPGHGRMRVLSLVTLNCEFSCSREK